MQLKNSSNGSIDPNIDLKRKLLIWKIIALIIVFSLLVILAHTIGVTYHTSLGGFQWINWELNSFFWFPFFLAGELYVGTFPPTDYPGLYGLTFVYWYFLSIIFCKLFFIVFREKIISKLAAQSN